MRKIILFISFFCLLCSWGYGQNTISLDSCITLAKSRNKSIDIARKQYEAAEFERKSMRAGYLPSFSVSSAVLWSSAGGDITLGKGHLPLDISGIPLSIDFPGVKLSYDLDWIYGGGVMMTQPLYLGGKLVAGYKMTRLGLDVAEQNIRLSEREVVLGTSTAYANVIRAEELKKVALQYNDLLDELMRTVERGMENGITDRNDLLKVKVKLNESELNLRRADNALRLARMNLCHYIGYPLDSDINVDITMPDFRNDGCTEASRVFNRPEYRMLQAKSEVALQQIRVSRADALPNIGLVAGYGYAHGLQINDDTFLDNSAFLAGVRINIPIFSFGKHYYKIQADRVRYKQSLSELENAYELMNLEMTSAENELDESGYELRLAVASLDAAHENLRVSRSHYEAGSETLSDLLEAQAMWQQAWQTKVETEVNDFLTWLSWKKAAGILD